MASEALKSEIKAMLVERLFLRVKPERDIR